jgi:DinB superfamily
MRRIHTKAFSVKITLDPVTARAEHQRAVEEFLAAARAVPADRWEQAPDDTHWSPSQIAEHVRMTYAVVGAQFAGGPGLRVRTSWWMRTVLRWKFLKRILEDGAFPEGARAPSEIRPGPGPFDREAVLAALQHAATATEERLISRWTDPSCQMTHHVFGALRPPQGARLVTVHTRHHAGQLAALSRG